MKIINSLMLSSILCSLLSASPIAKEDGFSGFIAAGVSSMKYKSNMYAGTTFDDEMSDKKIDNINSKADSDNSIQPSFNYNLKYTFAKDETEIYLGTLLEDVLTFDGTTVFGLRKKFDSLGILGVSLLGSSVPSKTWQDPYATGTDRKVADMTSRGISVKYEGIMNTQFDVELRQRTYKIDGGDKSGLHAPRNGEVAHGLTDSELNDELDREGDLSQLIISYTKNIENKHIIKTDIRLSDYDLDGKAMQYTRTGIKLDYLYLGEKWNFVGVFGISKDTYDKKNPLYAKKADSINVGGAITALYKNPFDLSKKLSLTATIAKYRSNSDINFYDSKINMINLGVLYNF